jgi:hypothetical protein
LQLLNKSSQVHICRIVMLKQVKCSWNIFRLGKDILLDRLYQLGNNNQLCRHHLLLSHLQNNNSQEDIQYTPIRFVSVLSLNRYQQGKGYHFLKCKMLVHSERGNSVVIVWEVIIVGNNNNHNKRN